MYMFEEEEKEEEEEEEENDQMIIEEREFKSLIWYNKCVCVCVRK